MYITLTIVFVIFLLLWRLGKYNHGYFDKLGINGPWPWPYLGNMTTMMYQGIRNFDRIFLDKYGQIYGSYFGSIPFLVTTDKEIIRQVFIKDAHLFTDRFSFGMEGYPLKKGITVLRGAEWKRVRNLMTPTFTAGKLKKMMPLIQSNVDTLKQKLLKSAENHENVDIKAVFAALSMDVIASTMFGIKIDLLANEDHPFYQHAKKVFRFSFANPFLLLLIFWPGAAKYVQRLKPSGFLPKDSVDYFVSAINAAIVERRKNLVGHHDFLALMLKARDEQERHHLDRMPLEATDREDSEHVEKEREHSETSPEGTSDRVWSESKEKGLSEEEMVAQSFIFLVAGFETTASTLQFCAFFLATHQDYQERCRQEIREVLGDEVPTYENVSQLQFLELCIQETMRIYSPGPRFDRTATQNVRVRSSDGRELLIPQGLSVIVPAQAIHMDPRIYESPDTFNPDRFADGKLEMHKNSYEFMPFGLGPRNCVGMRFAMLEMKVALAVLLSSVRIVVCDKTCEKPQFSLGGFTLKNPIILRMENI